MIKLIMCIFIIHIIEQLGALSLNSTSIFNYKKIKTAMRTMELY